ncbi:MAG: histidine kinase [Bacteroidota bacterium]
MTKSKIYWLCQTLGWGLYGLLQVIAYSAGSGFDRKQAIGVFLQVLFYILSTHQMRKLFIRWHWLNLKLASVIPRILMLALLFSLINYLYLLGVEFFISRITPQDLRLVNFLINILIYWSLYLLWAIFYFAFHYVDRYNKSLQAETATREVELSNLKAQLNPHFIFNALNSIRALVDENPVKSKESITKLSHLLRTSLASDRKVLVPFSEELEMVVDYLSLESIRYEERLTTQLDIDRLSDRFKVPPLLLQTLVENGVKHGTSKLKKGGIIKITSKVKGSTLLLEIRNSGQLSTTQKAETGFGIANTKKRLHLIFGEYATFEIKNEGKDLVLCRITIPRSE